MRAPRMDGKQRVYLALAMSTMCVLFAYTKFAMPHIMRLLEVGLS